MRVLQTPQMTGIRDRSFWGASADSEFRGRGMRNVLSQRGHFRSLPAFDSLPFSTTEQCGHLNRNVLSLELFKTPVSEKDSRTSVPFFKSYSIVE